MQHSNHYRRPRCRPLISIVLAACVGAVAACGAVPVGMAGQQVSVSQVPLSEDGRDRIGRLAFRGGIALRSDDTALGGLSDIRLGQDGTAFVAVSDSSAAVMGRLAYDRDGRLTGASDIAITPLNGEGGSPLSGKEGDAEGLVRLPEGGWLVSFERDHRVLHYPQGLGQGTPRRLQTPPELANLSNNGGLESLARLPDGRLLLIAEDGEGGGVSPAWFGRPGAWSAFGYQAREPFRPVGAAVLPDGDILVLERRASWIGGWGSRVVRIGSAELERAAAAGSAVEGVEVGRLDPPMSVDNYEGIDVRVSSDGRTLVYLVSDDNFSATQRTIILMFELLTE